MSKKDKKGLVVEKLAPGQEFAPPAIADTFQGPADLADLLKTAKRRNAPTLIKPGIVPMGGVVHGWIEKIVPSMVNTIKGKLIWLRQGEAKPKPGDLEFLFPLTGVIRQALMGPVPADDDDKADSIVKNGAEKEIGKYFIAKRIADGQSKRFPGKPMYMFDVFTCDGPGSVGK
jgi:hypothetical protein